jgi:hypothetical protein
MWGERIGYGIYPVLLSIPFNSIVGSLTLCVPFMFPVNRVVVHPSVSLQ